MILAGISKQELAKELDISYNTLLLKLQGKSKFTLNQAVKMKNIIHAEEPVEKLFEKSSENGERQVS